MDIPLHMVGIVRSNRRPFYPPPPPPPPPSSFRSFCLPQQVATFNGCIVLLDATIEQSSAETYFGLTDFSTLSSVRHLDQHHRCVVVCVATVAVRCSVVQCVAVCIVCSTLRVTKKSPAAPLVCSSVW